jgi:hypothetical protein
LSAIVFAAVGAAVLAGAREIRFRRFSRRCFLHCFLLLFTALFTALFSALFSAAVHCIVHGAVFCAGAGADCMGAHFVFLFIFMMPRF